MGQKCPRDLIPAAGMNLKEKESVGELGRKNLSKQDDSRESPGELDNSDLSWL